MHHVIVALALGAALVPLGCRTAAGNGRTALSNAAGAAPIAPVRLEAIAERDWVLQAWSATEPAAAEPPVTLRYAEGRFAGKSACNRYTGPVTPGEVTGECTVGAIASTRMMCPPPIFAVESRYLTALARATHVGLRGDRLAITYATEDGGTATLFFREAPARPRD